jgi:hypothetical protein
MVEHRLRWVANCCRLLALAQGRSPLLTASEYDHKSGTVPRPTLVHDKQGISDPHDNPSMVLDAEGHVWVFISGRGRHRPGYKYRSVAPHSVDVFELILEQEMTATLPTR